MSRRGSILGVGALVLFLSGCTVNFAKRSPWDVERLETLSAQLEQFRSLAAMKDQEAQQLRDMKSRLEQELSAGEAQVGYDERGLVARMVDQVLFDSGKAQLRAEASPVLDRVAKVLKEFPSQPVGIEGHTDNVPIKVSGWKDNQALSVARANSVVEQLTARGVEGGRLTAIGYGDSKPVASNATPEGRQKNRRVEIVIMPQASNQSYRDEAKRQNRFGFSK